MIQNPVYEQKTDGASSSILIITKVHTFFLTRLIQQSIYLWRTRNTLIYFFLSHDNHPLFSLVVATKTSCSIQRDVYASPRKNQVRLICSISQVQTSATFTQHVNLLASVLAQDETVVVTIY